MVIQYKYMTNETFPTRHEDSGEADGILERLLTTRQIYNLIETYWAVYNSGTTDEDALANAAEMIRHYTTQLKVEFESVHQDIRSRRDDFNIDLSLALLTLEEQLATSQHYVTVL